MASRRTRINRAAKVIAERFHLPKAGRIVAPELVDAIGCPDLMGAKEVAAELGVTVQNLRKVANLPEPVEEVSATPLWDAETVRAFARERRRNPPGRWNSKQKRRG
jgi:hypothetical protein